MGRPVVTIRCSDKNEETKAYYCGVRGLVVHKTNGVRQDWTITHTLSGLKINCGYFTLNDAVESARIIQASHPMPWDVGESFIDRETGLKWQRLSKNQAKNGRKRRGK